MESIIDKIDKIIAETTDHNLLFDLHIFLHVRAQIAQKKAHDQYLIQLREFEQCNNQNK